MIVVSNMKMVVGSVMRMVMGWDMWSVLLTERFIAIDVTAVKCIIRL